MHFYYETAVVIWGYLSSCSGQLFMESQVKNRWPLNQGLFQQDVVVFLYYISHWFGSAQQCLSMAEARDCEYHGSTALCKCPVWAQTPQKPEIHPAWRESNSFSSGSCIDGTDLLWFIWFCLIFPRCHHWWLFRKSARRFQEISQRQIFTPSIVSLQWLSLLVFSLMVQ